MSGEPREIESERLRLVPATPELVESELEDTSKLAAMLEADLPPDWPPEHHDAGAQRYSREALTAPGAAGWWLHYFVSTDGERPTLVGTGGYKGPPIHGIVEIGYSVVPSAQRRGYGTEAAGSLVESARKRGARRVRAETLPELVASIRVLEKLGFVAAEPSDSRFIAFAS